jgi:hypothetical protein
VQRSSSSEITSWQTRAHASRSSVLAALILFLLLLGMSTYFLPRWADWNQNSRFNLVVALVERGEVFIDAFVDNTGDYAFYQGHYYSDKAPGLALVAVPVYAAFYHLVPEAATASLASRASASQALATTVRPDGAGLESGRVRFFLGLVVTTFVTVAIPSAFLGVLIYWMLGQLGRGGRWGIVTAIVYGLGTCAFPYANSFVGHQPAAVLLFAAFALLFAIRRGTLSQRWAIAAGFLLSIAVVVEYPAALGAGILGIYGLAQRKHPVPVLLRYLLGALPPVMALVMYDLATFGSILPVGYFHSTLWSGVHSAGLVSITYPHLGTIWELTFGVHRGLLFLSPVLLFAIPGYVSLFRARLFRAELLVLVLVPLAFLLFNASSAMWSGGFSVGPRYMLPGLPFLATAAGVGLAVAWHTPIVRPVVVTAILWSFVAVWTESIAGQSFPDYTANPLLDFALPKLAAGDIARNVGMLAGLSGWMSLLPLMGLFAVAAIFTYSTAEGAFRGSSPELISAHAPSAPRDVKEPGWNDGTPSMPTSPRTGESVVIH